MPDFLTFRLDTTIEAQLDASMRGKVAMLEQALVAKLDYLNAMLQSKIVGEKLQGQVLNAITGKLARSVEMIPAAAEAGTITGSVQAGGGAAFYGRMQEMGTQGPYEIRPVKARVLAFMLGGKMVFAKKVVHPGLQPRSFVGSTFDEMRGEFIAQLQATPGEVGAV